MTKPSTSRPLPGLAAARRHLASESLNAFLNGALRGKPVDPPSDDPDGNPAAFDIPESAAPDEPEPWRRREVEQCLEALAILRLAAADRAANGPANRLKCPGRIVRVLLPDAEDRETFKTAATALWLSAGMDQALWEGPGPEASRSTVEQASRSLGALVRRGRSVLILSSSDVGIPGELLRLTEAELHPAPLSGEMLLAVLTLSHSPTGRLPRTARRTLPTDADLARLSSLQLGLALAETCPDKVVARLSEFCASQRTTTGPKLEDVFGQPEAIGFFCQLRTDLDDWRSGRLDWGEVTASALLFGPPGTGKSLTPMAFANSAGIPFVATSYAACQKFGHQGDMLAALDRAVTEAIRLAPAVLFIDEIDAFYQRGPDNGRNSTYNIGVVTGLLTQIDRLRRCPGVIFVAATNFPDLVDEAIIRSGRLDRHIPILPLDRAGIEAFLTARFGPDLSGDPRFHEVVDRLVGATGAVVEDFIRKTRTLARELKQPLSMELILRAADLHLPRQDTPLLRRIAVHEAGHLLAATILGCPPARLVRVSATNGFVSREKRTHHTPDSLSAELAVLFAGRAAERLILGNPSSGAGAGPDSDLALATRLATHAEAQWAFGPELILWHDLAALPRPGDLSPELAHRITARLREAETTAQALISENRDALEQVAEALIQQREIGGAKLERLLKEVRQPPREDLAATAPDIP